jgi:chorismate mutase/prephenate dehydratase
MSSLPHTQTDQAATGPDPQGPRDLQATPAEELALLRAELDHLDDVLHDTLRSRAAIVTRIGASAAKGTLKLRMGRQAEILRRILARHDGAYPPASVVRVWLELLSGTIAMQAPFSVAVGQAEGDAALSATAREQFGALARLRAWGSVGQAIGEVRAGTASVAVLPLPHEGEAMSAAWWTGLLNRNGPNRDGPNRDTPGAVPRLHIVARLPIWSPRPEGAPAAQALVVAGVPPDPSGADRTLLGLELAPEGSRTRLLAALPAAGLTPGRVLLRRDPGTARALVEVEGFVTEGDPRLSAASLQALGDSRHGPVVLGAYAIPLGANPASPR